MTASSAGTSSSSGEVWGGSGRMEGALALEVVDHDRFGGVVRRRVVQARRGHGTVARIVVDLVARVQRFVGRRVLLATEVGVDDPEVVVRGHVLGVEPQRALEGLGRTSKVGLALGAPRLAPLLLGPLVEREPQLLQQTVVAREVEAAARRLAETALEDLLVVADRLVEAPVLRVDQAAEPEQRPLGGRRIELRRAAQG